MKMKPNPGIDQNKVPTDLSPATVAALPACTRLNLTQSSSSDGKSSGAVNTSAAASTNSAIPSTSIAVAPTPLPRPTPPAGIVGSGSPVSTEGVRSAVVSNRRRCALGIEVSGQTAEAGARSTVLESVAM
eukprot:m.374977 g.374977  ORF g.374977 m.374977 type:complete len:130 (-) comp16694_c0_seq3:186-575(-)